MADEQTLLSAERQDTGQRVTIGITPLDVLRTISDARLLICPHCQSPVILKAGDTRRQHFAHLDLTQCADAYHEPESEYHRAGKLKLYQHFSQQHPEAEAVIEQGIPATGQRADTFFRFPNGIMHALEFQQAENSIQTWRERRAKYRLAGVRDIWFLSHNRFRPSRRIPFQTPSRLGLVPVPRDAFGVQDGAVLVHELEKAVADADGILYFLDPAPEHDELLVLLPQDLSGNTLRTFLYTVPLQACRLEHGKLWTPLTPLLDDYREYRREFPLILLP